MMFAFNDTMVSNLKCIVSACNSEDIIEDFNKKKVTLLKEHMFDAIVRNNINEAKGLIRKIESVNTESKNELTPLYMAIQGGRLDVVKVLFDRKHFSVKDKDIYGCNPLHWAAQQGNLNIAKFLVDKGADIGAKGNDGRTPLRIAAYNGKLDMVKFFLDKNASIEAKSNDPYKMMGIVESAKKEIINQADTAPNIKRWAEFFVEKLRYSIKNVVQKKLKDGMLHDLYDSVSGLADEIYRSDGKLFDDIIKGVINDVYGKVDTKKILSFVRNHGYIAQLISSYVAVFDTMQRNNDLNNGAVFKLAYYVKEVMEMKNYSDVNQEDRSNLEELKSRLPESVRNAVFASEVCIKNIDHNEYLYAASNYFSYDDDRRRVFTWIPKDEKNDKFRWEIKLDGDDYSIMNVEFNEYLYGAVDHFNYDNERRKVFTWIPGGRVGRDTWKIEPIGSSCYIMNVELNEYLYAAGNYFSYDDDRRRVFTWIPGGKVTQGVWKIEDCGHAVKRRDISSSHNDLNSDTTRSSRKTELDKELLSATKIGDLSKVKDLINQGARINAEDKDGNTPFHNAALKGHLTIAQYLVEKGVDVNASNEDGWTPMHGAALKGHLEVVRFLIEKGANISAENIFGEKPIHCAAKRNNKDIIEVLLRKGASINDADKNGRTPLYFASWNGYLGLVEHFVRDKKANINIKDKYGKTPLDVAIDRNHISVIGYLSKKQLELCKELLVVVQSGDLSKVQDLVNQGASLDIQSEDGLTLLHFASINNRLDIAGYLIKEGVDINAKDKDGKTPLHYASRSVHHLDMVQYLISKGADIDVKDNSGRTPEDEERYTNSDRMRQVFMQAHLDRELLLTVKNEKDLKTINNRIAKDIDDRTHGGFYYTWSGNLDTVKFLVSTDVSVNTTDKYGCTLLHWSALKGHSSIAEFLVDKEANVNAKDILGRTPMHFAVMNNHKDIQDVYGRGPTYTTAESNDEEIVQLFLMKGASINEVDKNGETPLHLASRGGHFGILQDLINNGANIGTKDSSGKTPLDIARDKGHNNIVQYLQQTQLTLDKQLLIAIGNNDLNKVIGLVNLGASLDAKDEYGWTSLHLAASQGYLEVTKFLVGKGTNINAKDKNGKTPQDIAIDQKHDSVAVYLQQTQLGLNEQLLVAVRSNDVNKVKDLVSKGASVDTKDSDGWTLLHHTARRGYLEVAEFLIEKGADINAEDKYGKKPIQRAAEDNNKNIITLLLSKGVNINDTDRNGRTSLYWASWSGHLDVVKYLIGEGADINARDKKDGKTPLNIARDKGHDNIAEYLEKKLNEKGEKPVQRKRRHHHGDHARHHMSRKPLAIDSSNQPEIATSSAIKPSSWINGLLGWVKSSIGGLVSSVADKFAAEESENSKLGDTGPCSAGLEKMYSAIIPQSRKSLCIPKGNIPNRIWSSNREKVRSNVTIAPEINTAVVDSALILGDLAVRLVNGRRHKQPIHENLLSPRERSMGFIDEDMIIRAIQQGKEKFGVPGTKMDEVEIIGNKTEIGK